LHGLLESSNDILGMNRVVLIHDRSVANKLALVAGCGPKTSFERDAWLPTPSAPSLGEPNNNETGGRMRKRRSRCWSSRISSKASIPRSNSSSRLRCWLDHQKRGEFPKEPCHRWIASLGGWTNKKLKDEFLPYPQESTMVKTIFLSIIESRELMGIRSPSCLSNHQGMISFGQIQNYELSTKEVKQQFDKKSKAAKKKILSVQKSTFHFTKVESGTRNSFQYDNLKLFCSPMLR